MCLIWFMCIKSFLIIWIIVELRNCYDEKKDESY